MFPPIGAGVNVCWADGDHSVKVNATYHGEVPEGLVVTAGAGPITIKWSDHRWVEDVNGRPIRPESEVLPNEIPEAE